MSSVIVPEVEESALVNSIAEDVALAGEINVDRFDACRRQRVVRGDDFGPPVYVVGANAVEVLPLMHPRIRYGGPRLIAAAGDNPGLEETLDPPGFYALGYPAMIAMGFLMLHLLFGLVFGALHGAWAG